MHRAAFDTRGIWTEQGYLDGLIIGEQLKGRMGWLAEVDSGGRGMMKSDAEARLAVLTGNTPDCTASTSR